MTSSTTQVPSRRDETFASPWFAGILAAAVVLLFVVATLTADLRNRLVRTEATDAEAALWAVTQIEVDALQLRLSVAAAAGMPDDLIAQRSLRRSFDRLFGRLAVLSSGPVGAQILDLPENRIRLNMMRRTLDTWTPLIDADRDTLAAALPRLQTEALVIQGLARELAEAGHALLEEQSGQREVQLSQALWRLVLAVVALAMLLAMLAVIQTRQSRLLRQIALDEQTAAARLQMIIADSPDAIVVTNRGGWTVEFNPAAEAMFGLPRSQIVKRQAVPLLFAAQHIAQYQTRISAAIADAITKGPQRFELLGHRADGTLFPLEISLASRPLGQGALIVAFMRDISARKAVETALHDALLKARAGERAKADFVAIMSHEMRTPLNGMLGSVALLQDTVLTPDQSHLVDVIASTGHVLLGHMNSVLETARTEAGQISLADIAFDLDHLISECLDNQTGLARQNGTSLRHSPLTGPFGTVRGDPARLRQILLNLIGNAVKFTHDGMITLETERDGPTPKGLPGMVEFRIIDTGVGIAEADQQRIFEDYETLGGAIDGSATGTGLGLGIARRLVLAMGGDIGVESEPGEGSVFWVRLPLPPSAATAFPTSLSATLSANLPRPERPLEILVIEDNDINRFVLRRFLEEDGHRVVEARDGLEGLSQAEAKPFDVILTDISMPGLDGIETTRRIRAGNGPCARTRIIALTAHALPAELERFKAAGIDTCLTKPVTRETLASELAKTIPPGPVAPLALAPSSHAVPESRGDDAQTLLIDPQSFQDLADILGRAQVEKLVQRLGTEAHDTIDALTSGRLSPAEMALRAHHLAGACATFGTTRLRLALSAVEDAAQSGDFEIARNEAALLPDIWERTEVALQARINDLPG